MTVPTILFSERLAPISTHEEALRRELQADLQLVPLWTVDDIVARGGMADALIIGSVEPLTRVALESLTRCRVIVRRGIGVDNVDLDAATDVGIPVAFVPDASVPEVSDHALALVLAVERRIVALDRFVKAGRWSTSTSGIVAARTGIRRLSDLTLGVVGFGRIGREFARKAAPLFARTVVFDPFVSDAPHEIVDFPTLMSLSDVVSVHSPLTDETAHLFDAAAFERMKPGSTIVNTSRGGLIDASALIDAIRSGRLRGAGLDVTETEPMESDDELLSLDNVVLTGHSASSSAASAEQLRAATALAVRDALQGRRPAFVANEEVFSRPTCRLASGGTS